MRASVEKICWIAELERAERYISTVARFLWGDEASDALADDDNNIVYDAN
jgi:hypothetical protein